MAHIIFFVIGFCVGYVIITIIAGELTYLEKYGKKKERRDK